MHTRTYILPKGTQIKYDIGKGWTFKSAPACKQTVNDHLNNILQPVRHKHTSTFNLLLRQIFFFLSAHLVTFITMIILTIFG